MPKEIEYNNADPTKKTFIVVDKMQEALEKYEQIHNGLKKGFVTQIDPSLIHKGHRAHGFYAGFKAANLLPTEKVCPKCGGDGSRCYAIADLDSYATCETCNGNGTIPIYYTPEQYQEIKGKKWPADSPVWGIKTYDDGVSDTVYGLFWHKYATPINGSVIMIIANEAGQPPADYRPEE